MDNPKKSIYETWNGRERYYPASGAPEPLATAFYLNPLTYLVDVIRAGIFGTFNDFVITEMIILIVLASGLFLVATKLLTKQKTRIPY